MSICRDCLYLDVEYIFSGVGEAEKKYPYAVCRRLGVTIPRKNVDEHYKRPNNCRLYRRRAA